MIQQTPHRKKIFPIWDIAYQVWHSALTLGKISSTNILVFYSKNCSNYAFMSNKIRRRIKSMNVATEKKTMQKCIWNSLQKHWLYGVITAMTEVFSLYKFQCHVTSEELKYIYQVMWDLILSMYRHHSCRVYTSLCLVCSQRTDGDFIKIYVFYGSEFARKEEGSIVRTVGLKWHKTTDWRQL